MGIYGSEWSDVDLCLLLLVLFMLHCNEGSGQDYKLEQHQNLVFMCHITEQHDYCHLGMFSTCENRFYSRLLQLFVHG